MPPAMGSSGFMSSSIKNSVKRPTLADVAELAGVSLGSASRALSVPERVKSATLQRVRAAVEQLGYVSNGAARALASRRTYTIGAVFPTMYNQAFVDALQTLQATLWSMNYQVILATHEYQAEREFDVIKTLVERGVEGIVLVGSTHEERVYELLRQRQLPLVLTWQRDEPPYGVSIGFDNWRATYRMAQEVIALGHRAIAVVCGSQANNNRSRQRVDGIAQAMQERRLRLDESQVYEAPFTIEGGRDAARRLLAAGKPPTAILCMTDVQALGVLDELGQAGWRVPQDISVTGMDNIEFSALAQPALTTIDVPSRAIGALAARRIVSMVEQTTFIESAELACSLVLRQSLGVPREGG